MIRLPPGRETAARARPAKRPGAAPGELIHEGERRAERMRIRVAECDAAETEELRTEEIPDCLRFKGTPQILKLAMLRRKLP